MRLPRPAAGTMAHISGSFGYGLARTTACRMLQQRDQFGCSLLRAVLIQGPFAGAPGHRRQLVAAELKGGKRILCVTCEHDLLAGFEEALSRGPAIAEQRHPTGRCLEQATGPA